MGELNAVAFRSVHDGPVQKQLGAVESALVRDLKGVAVEHQPVAVFLTAGQHNGNGVFVAANAAAGAGLFMLESF
jgi:hypothetical protein